MEEQWNRGEDRQRRWKRMREKEKKKGGRGTSIEEKLDRLNGASHGGIVEGRETDRVLGVHFSLRLKQLFHNRLISVKGPSI